MESENCVFANEWEVIRKKGFKRYILTKTIALGVMMFFIYIINVFLSKDIDYLMVGILHLLITLIAPIISWFFNEKRYKKHKKGN